MTVDKTKIGEAAMRLLLEKLGYPKRKQVGVIEEVTKLGRVQATRKLTGLSPWDINEYAEHCEALGSNIFDVLRAAETKELLPATLLIGAGKVPCHIKLAKGASTSAKHHFMATQRQLNWYVEHIEEPLPNGAQLVEKLLLSAVDEVSNSNVQTVAVLDDDRDMCDSLCDELTLGGFKTVPFYNVASFLDELQNSTFDAFVLDWILHTGTVESALIEIRKRHHNEPIALLTGRAGDEDGQIGRLAACLTKYNARYFTKPTPTLIMIEALSQNLEN